MTVSMTGYAAKEMQYEIGQIQLELRSVNSRYLDLHFKLDDEVKSLEPELRELLKTNIGRGKVECKINVVKQSNKALINNLNHDALKDLSEMCKAVRNFFPNSAEMSVNEILNWPDVLATSHVNKEKLVTEVVQLGQQVLDELNASRSREGEKLKTIILDRLAQVEALIVKVKPLMATIVKMHQEKLEQKLNEVMKTLDAERITQELVLFAQRIDVDEELVRLTSHVSEIKRILSKSEPAGKRLDFMMQELNREANTLGAKSVSLETTQASMQLKVLIEQMREQVQNLE
jgi:uncharacterized protein (TIGR00255 family)